MSTKRKVKKVNDHLIALEIDKLNKLIVLVVESKDLLEQLGSLSISEFEDSINKKSGFVNAMMSATAYGKDVEYKRLLELEKQINRRLSIEDLTSAMELKSSVIANIKEMNTEHYSEDEMKAKTVIEKVMKEYNKLSYTERRQAVFNHSFELVYGTFSDL